MTSLLYIANALFAAVIAGFAIGLTPAFMFGISPFILESSACADSNAFLAFVSAVVAFDKAVSALVFSSFADCIFIESVNVLGINAYKKNLIIS